MISRLRPERTVRGARVWPVLVAAVAVAVVLAVAVAVTANRSGDAARRAAEPAAAPATTAAATPTPGPSTGNRAVDEFRSVREFDEVAEPVRLRIPAVGVDSSLQHVGLAGDGTVAAPDEWQQAGWYDRGPRPGQPAPAVIVGHVDSKSGPAVFYRLPELKDGDEVLVDREDGSTATFRVTGTLQVAKSQFPADLVYAPTLATVLRLVTCGGDFDASTGHYVDNVVVTAVAA